MVKKLLTALLLLTLLPCAALAGGVFDDADLFTSSEISALEATIEDMWDAYAVDVFVLTSEDAPYNRSLDYADLFYEENSKAADGLVYFIDMRNRVPTISTSGSMIDLITDDRLNVLLDAGYDDLARGRYGDAAKAVLRQLGSYLRQGRVEGSYRYDAETSQRLTNRYNTLTAGEAGIAALAGLVVAGAFVLAIERSYQLKGGTYRYNLAENASRSLTEDEERFLRQHVTRRVNPPPPPTSSSSGGHGGGSGSAVHHSSGGGSHGGGSGRHF